MPTVMSIVTATMDLLNWMNSNLCPTPLKPHYIFSLRDFSRLVSGLLLVKRESVDNKKIFIKYAMEHLVRIIRILSIQGGNCVLIGVNGSGRQTITKLAAAVTKYWLFQPSITNDYGLYEWHTDLKHILKETGARRKKTVLLVTQDQLKNENVFQEIDILLTCGQIPNIFNFDEEKDILEAVRLAAQGGNRNLDISPLAVFTYFVNICKENLHVVLCFSPVGVTLRRSLYLYKSLLKSCAIDWFQDWPEEALEKTAREFLVDLQIKEDNKVSLISAFKYFYVTVREIADSYFMETGRKVYITSSSYLNILKIYTRLMSLQQSEVMEKKLSYIGGLDKLDFASSQVLVMQTDLEKLQPQLTNAADETLKMMEVIERETAQVENASALVREDEKIAKIQAHAANELKTECEADLALAIPILEEAIAALNTLKPTDITLVKSMKNPPDTVKLVMAAVCVMKDIKPEKVLDPNNPGKRILDYWGPSKRLLGDMGFLQQLKEFDKDNIPPQIMVTIRKQYIPNKDFKPNIVAKASSAAEGLCKWVIAMDMYDAVAKEVAPKKEKLETAEREFAATMVVLEEKREQVRMLEKKLADLNSTLDSAQAKKKQLENEVNMCSNKLSKAKRLIDGLGGEKERWLEAVASLQAHYDSLAGDILVCSGMIAYLSAFKNEYRQKIMNMWLEFCSQMEIPHSEEFSFSRVLGKDVKIQKWHICGLPRDIFSVDNAIILDSSDRWPLLVDPQGYATAWIKMLEENNNLQMITTSDSKYIENLTTYMKLGKHVLLEAANEDLDTSLDPLLFKQTYKEGDDAVVYNPGFYLYITTKLSNPEFGPGVFNKVTVIDFSLTVEGLQDQLLGIVFAKERPDLQEEKRTLAVESADNKNVLNKIEESILQTLSSTEGNILEDEKAIDILDSSKMLSMEMKQKLNAVRQSGESLDSVCQGYFTFAEYSATLYYCLTDLPNIDPMYQFSLPWFIDVYILSIETAAKKSIQQSEVKLFLHDCKEEHPLEMTCAPEWLTSHAWKQICRLQNFLPFTGLAEHFVNNLHSWKVFCETALEEDVIFPLPWDNTLTKFQKLILLKILLPEKVVSYVLKFVEDEMGAEFITVSPFNISCSFEESNCLSPLIFLISPGVDPLEYLITFAKKKRVFGKLQTLSLGKSQGQKAQELVTSAQAEGCWVFLQNCHIVPEWLPDLKKLCESFSLQNTSMDFRLWLSTSSTSKFPVSILQNSIKMAVELPSNFKKNLLQCYKKEPVSEKDFFQGCPGKENVFAKLLYVLSFFNVLIQERKKYGYLGWSIPYEFSEYDYHLSVKQLKIYINEYKRVPYEAVHLWLSESNYGGHITDSWDQRILSTILTNFCNRNIIETANYAFCHEHRVPLRFDYKDFISTIEKMPDSLTYDICYLDRNAGIILSQQETVQLLDTINLLQGPQFAVTDGYFDDVYNATVNMLDKLPENLNSYTKEKYTNENNDCLNSVLIKEIRSYDCLLKIITSSLQCLQKSIKGVISMSPLLDDIGDYLNKDLVPKAWQTVSYPTVKPLGGYISDLLERLGFFQHWYLNGSPTSFQLSYFFFPCGFFGAAMLNFSQKHNVPVTQLDFDSIVCMENNIQSDDGVLVDGLFIEGAQWDTTRNSLEEAHTKVFFSALPTIWFKPILKCEINTASRYICPVYKTTRKYTRNSNFITTMLLDTKNFPASHWITRSVAVICQHN